ncbi:hypothetical protein Tco_0497893 [Tanacetum coccineum]
MANGRIPCRILNVPHSHEHLQCLKRLAYIQVNISSIRTSISQEALEELISQRVADALATYDTNRSNGDDSHDSRSGGRRTVHTTRECTYSEFLKCQPLNFKGTEGAFATCTLLGSALTWWNFHVRTVGHDAAYGMPWKTLMKMMTENYCPRSEIKNLETELWNLVVKRMVPNESDKVKQYTSGLPDSIQGSVMASKPKMLQEVTELASR